MTDEEIKENYYRSQGLTTVDASRQYFLKKAKEIGKAKGYKLSGYNKLKVKQLRAICS